MGLTSALDTGLYTLTSTHCGTGQAAGAIDLPIARERHTGFPFIPSSSLKGVVRDLVEGLRGGERWSDDARRYLLGADPPGEQGSEDRLRAGQLVLTDGRLLAFPVRSLQAPFFWITCPLVVDRWERSRRALGLEEPKVATTLRAGASAAGAAHGDGRLVLEDHLHDDVAWENGAMQRLAGRWCRLLPGDEETTRDGLRRRLVCVPDDVFQDLVSRTTPVQARVKLTGGKTTDRWRNPDGHDEEGNLWYEETLPSDCLFSVLATSRRRNQADMTAIEKLLTDPPHAVIQVGGNETVGQGLCWWRPEAAEGDSDAR